jgi:hypothetical protein
MLFNLAGTHEKIISIQTQTAVTEVVALQQENIPNDKRRGISSNGNKRLLQWIQLRKPNILHRNKRLVKYYVV